MRMERDGLETLSCCWTIALQSSAEKVDNELRMTTADGNEKPNGAVADL